MTMCDGVLVMVRVVHVRKCSDLTIFVVAPSLSLAFTGRLNPD